MLGKLHADVAELVDALASGASVCKYVEVQVLSSAPNLRNEIFRRVASRPDPPKNHISQI